jgi:hypothetical protein
LLIAYRDAGTIWLPLSSPSTLLPHAQCDVRCRGFSGVTTGSEILGALIPAEPVSMGRLLQTSNPKEGSTVGFAIQRELRAKQRCVRHESHPVTKKCILSDYIRHRK